MVDRLTYVVLEGLFLFIAINNLRFKDRIKIKALVRPYEKLASLVSILVFFFITYRYGRGFFDYVLCLTASLMFLSMVFLTGLGEEGLYTIRGRAMIVKEISWEDIDYLKLGYGRGREDILVLETKGPYGRTLTNFTIGQKKELESLINRKYKKRCS